MTPEQISNAKKILQEETKLAVESIQLRWLRNGEDFPDLAELALQDEHVKDAIRLGAIKVMMHIVMSREPPASLSRPEEMPRDPLFNEAALDMLWLGYRLGRRMEHAEMEAMEGFKP